jgi:hypothetical protein
MKKKLYLLILITLTSFYSQAQVINYKGKIPLIENVNTDSDIQDLYFYHVFTKGDSLIGFNKDYYSISYNLGKSWETYLYNGKLFPTNWGKYSDKPVSEVFINGKNLVIKSLLHYFANF